MIPNVIKIPQSEIVYDPASYADAHGRLFWWKGQPYRAVKQTRKDLYIKLFQDGVIQNLMEKGLMVKTEITNLTLDGYDLVLKHERVAFASYPYEWSAEMLKDAALLIVDLQIELSRHGLTLQDGHSFNVLFDGCRPVFVDFGSIVPWNNESSWVAYDQFRSFFINPLQLMAHGQGRIARLLLHDLDQGVLDSELVALTPVGAFNITLGQAVAKPDFDLIQRLISLLKRLAPQRIYLVLNKLLMQMKSTKKKQNPGNYQSPLEFLQQMKRQIELIQIPSAQTEWSSYYKSQWLTFSPSDEWTQKHRTVYDVLSDLHPSSVLDIASNEGWYSQLAAVLGSRVVAFDVDETTVTNLYGRNKMMNLPVLPLVMDFRNPSPGYGLCNLSFPPAIMRFGCEMVLALALIHHLVFKQHLNLEQIVETLSAFSKRWLLVEFIPPEDQFVRLWSPEKFPWYTLNNFIAVLEKRFQSVKVLPSSPDPRVFLLCEK